MDALAYLKQQLGVELNATDDNPCLLPEEDRMCGSPNFEPLTWVLAVEMASTGLAHMSKMISQQILRIGDPGFTKLNRFLTPAEGLSSPTGPYRRQCLIWIRRTACTQSLLT